MKEENTDIEITEIDDSIDSDKYEIENDIVIFDPRGVKDYKKQYPELNRTFEFQALSDLDLKFVWWVSNPTSPIVLNIQNMLKRGSRAYYKTYGRNHYDKAKMYNLCNNKFPDSIRQAMQKMSMYSVDDRYRANKIVDKAFTDIESINNLNINDFKDSSGNIDYTKFVNTKRMIIEELPKLLKIKEEGFGVDDVKNKNKDMSGQSTISGYLKNKKDE